MQEQPRASGKGVCPGGWAQGASFLPAPAGRIRSRLLAKAAWRRCAGRSGRGGAQSGAVPCQVGKAGPREVGKAGPRADRVWPEAFVCAGKEGENALGDNENLSCAAAAQGDGAAQNADGHAEPEERAACQRDGHAGQEAQTAQAPAKLRVCGQIGDAGALSNVQIGEAVLCHGYRSLPEGPAGAGKKGVVPST